MASEEKEVFLPVYGGARIREMLQKAYYNMFGMTVDDTDREVATKTDSSLCFGEVLPEGVSKMLDKDHLHASSAKVLYDLGMGLGKLAMQAFLEYPNLDKVVGMELAYSRCEKGKSALAQLAEITPSEDTSWKLTKLGDGTFKLTETRTISDKHESLHSDSKVVYKPQINPQSQEKKIVRERLLEFRRGNLFQATDCKDADIIVCETKIRPSKFKELCLLLNSVKKGARILTYEDLDEVYRVAKVEMPWRRLSSNTPDDLFPATWSAQGTHFHLFEKSC